MDILANILGYPITYIELFGVITYFISVYLAIKVNKWTWITGIISQILFFVLYFNMNIYASAFLQIILIIICVKGWLKWNKEDKQNITNLSLNLKLYIFIISISFILFIGSIINLIVITPDPYPYLDMSIFVLSIVGVVLLAYKKIESWFVWIIVNLITLVLSILLGYYLVVIQCIILIIMNIIALKNWYKLKN